MKPINYGYLAKKYLGAKVVVRDRTYEGLEWRGPGEKPPISVFQSFQEEEDREARVHSRKQEVRLGLAEERQHQARAKALEDIRPFEDKLREAEKAIYDETSELRRQALEAQSLLLQRDQVDLMWREIAKAQDIIEKEAIEFLAQTAFYLTFDPIKIPADIAEKRARAQEILLEAKGVYAAWNTLRELEMPSREEIRQAILAGGKELERIKKACKEAALKYPKPRIQHF